MAWPKWRHMLAESERQALHALDCYNSPSGNYSDFVVHMHMAWLYLLHARYHRDGTDYHYRDQSGAQILLDGEPKAWELATCVQHGFDETSPIRKNLELFISLRNKIEHRHERALQIAIGGRAHALVINYDGERVHIFGPNFSIGDQLRFPISVHAITDVGNEELRKLVKTVPKRTSAFIAHFDAELDKATLEDPRFDYRIRLVPMIGPKSDADLALDFVNLDKLHEDDRERLVKAGREGSVITKIKHVEVLRKDCLPAKRAAEAIEKRLPFRFNVHHHTVAWRKLAVRPAGGAGDPRATDAKYCLFDEPFRQYAYTPAWVDRIVREVGTVEKFRAFFGSEPRMKPGKLPAPDTHT